MIRNFRAALALAFALLLSPVAFAQGAFPGASVTADFAWRDYNTPGVAASGPYNPQKSLIRSWGGSVESALTQLYGASAAGQLGYQTQAALYADLAHAANTVATVFADPSPLNNGTYVKSGASGSGSWLQVSTSTFGLLPTWSVGTVTTLPPGGTPAATVGGTPGAPLLNLSLPASQTLAIGTVTTVSSGIPAAATLTGTPSSPLLNLTIPRGVDGSNSFAWRGAWSSVTTYAVNDVVSYNGSSYIAVVSNTNVTPTSGATWNTLLSGSAFASISPGAGVATALAQPVGGYGGVDIVAENNTELSTIAASAAPSVLRLGFAYPGDAGAPVRYVPVHQVCNNAGAGDGGYNVPTATAGWCWIGQIDTIDPRIWGAKENFKPAYNSGQTYSAGQQVSYSGSIYQSVSNGNVGNAVSNATYWTNLGAMTDDTTAVQAAVNYALQDPAIAKPVCMAGMAYLTHSITIDRTVTKTQNNFIIRNCGQGAGFGVASAIAMFDTTLGSYAGPWVSYQGYSAGQVVTRNGVNYASISGGNLNHAPPNATYWTTASQPVPSSEAIEFDDLDFTATDHALTANVISGNLLKVTFHNDRFNRIYAMTVGDTNYTAAQPYAQQIYFDGGFAYDWADKTSGPGAFFFVGGTCYACGFHNFTLQSGYDGVYVGIADGFEFAHVTCEDSHACWYSVGTRGLSVTSFYGELNRAPDFTLADWVHGQSAFGVHFTGNEFQPNDPSVSGRTDFYPVALGDAHGVFGGNISYGNLYNDYGVGAAQFQSTGDTAVGVRTPAAWSSTTTYSKGQTVSSGGAFYQSLTDSNLNNAVSDGTHWTQFCASGCAGTQSGGGVGYPTAYMKSGQPVVAYQPGYLDSENISIAANTGACTVTSGSTAPVQTTATQVNITASSANSAIIVRPTINPSDPRAIAGYQKIVNFTPNTIVICAAPGGSGALINGAVYVTLGAYSATEILTAENNAMVTH